MEKCTVGLIGLATMGANLARNFSNKEIRTAVYNRTTEKTREYIKEFGSDYLVGKEDLASFIDSLEKPRKIIVMVKAGEAVDEMIQQLLPLLDKGDIIVDCGNSNYTDTLRREHELLKNEIHFMGCGVSGGEEGALHGPSLMPGGSDRSWEILKPYLMKIAAKDFEGYPCVTHVGENGAGHYVKMVHNGIEYAVMQIMAEAYDLLKRTCKLSPEKIAEIFQQYGRGRLESYLFEIVVPVLRKKDDHGNGYLIDHILDKAGQKGTGKWTAVEGLERAVGVSSISEAVFARINSGEKELRKSLASSYPKPTEKLKIANEDFIKKLENALYASLLSIYAQGFELIKKGAQENNWKINLSEIARVWQGGCIIRARLLKFLTDLYKKADEQVHLFQVDEICETLQDSLEDWREVVSLSLQNGVPTPAMTSALQYLDALSTEVLPANLLQGLRDYFGAHTYERTDRPGSFHTDWLT
jgi:6-phosphogluconate dehydrogenase